jgi:hypothetical protein
MSQWETFNKGFAAWETTTAATLEKLLRNPMILGPSGIGLTALMKLKTASDRAAAAWWSAWGLPTRRDQERLLHKLDRLESKLLDVEERLEDAATPPARTTTTVPRPTQPAA